VVDTSEPVDGYGVQNMVTVQFGFRTRDLSITGPTHLPTALTRPTILERERDRERSSYRQTDTHTHTYYKISLSSYCMLFFVSAHTGIITVFEEKG
jgi:hypothetical protein